MRSTVSSLKVLKYLSFISHHLFIFFFVQVMEQHSTLFVLKQCIYSSTVLIPSLFVNTIKGRKKFRGGKKNSRQFEKLCK